MKTLPSRARLVALGALAATSWIACTSSGVSTHGGAGTTGSSTGGAGASGSSSSGSTGGSTASSAGGSTSTSGSTSSSSGGSVWQPTTTAPIHYHWMIGSFTTADILTGQVGQAVYDIDGQEATAADVAAIHAAGAIAVCYVDVGTLENWRSDYDQFPKSVIGPADCGWPGENWLLVTAANQSIILPLMKARFVDWCQAKGFDAIEPDNLDAFDNGVAVSEADNLAYDLAIASLARGLGFSIGLKNLMTDLDASQYPTFTSAFDWALNEQCYECGNCDAYSAAGSFLPAGKAVFDVEYNVSPDCAQADQIHMNAELTDLDLVGATQSGYEYTPCVPDDQDTWP